MNLISQFLPLLYRKILYVLVHLPNFPNLSDEWSELIKKGIIMKTVIFIRTYSIYNDSRDVKEILSLYKSGYHVIVLGWDRDNKAISRCRDIFPQDIEFKFFPVKLDTIGFRNIDKLFLWFKWEYCTIKKITKDKTGVIFHACDLDAGLPVYYFLRNHNNASHKLVYDIYDYYADTHSVPNVFKTYIEKMENSIINRADITIICNDERKKQIANALPHKLLVIHNSPDLRGITLPTNESLYDFVYCGGLSNDRLLKEIFQQYSEHSELKVVVAGKGINSFLAQRLSTCFSNFIFKGPVTYNEVLDLESKGKVLFAVYNPDVPNNRLSAPNKFYESLALGKPIIVCRGTGIDKLVEKYNLGLSIPYNANEFYKALNTLLKNPGLCREMGRNGRKLFKEKYNWERMEKKLLEAYSEL